MKFIFAGVLVVGLIFFTARNIILIVKEVRSRKKDKSIEKEDN